MFISIVFNIEYFDISSRIKGCLKSLQYCKKNGWVLITHEYIQKHFSELQNGLSQSMFDSWEMPSFSQDELKDVEQYFVADELFDNLEKDAGSRTEMLFNLSQEDSPLLEERLRCIFRDIRRKHPQETIDGVFHFLEPWKSVRNICDENGAQLIPYCFSAIRKQHGYRQTLYNTNLTECLYSTNECRARYEAFLADKRSRNLVVFSHRELVAIFGKERTLPLIPLIDQKPKYEMGICTECFSVIPHIFIHDRTTDDDVRMECERIFDKKDISVRNHSVQVDNMRLDRTMMHSDPAAWILSCKRLSATRSQILLKAMLWNRTAIMKTDTLGFSFLCAKDFKSTEKVEIRALNYYLFGYLVPNDLMFDGDYWKWRKTFPSEADIYLRHLEFYGKVLGLGKHILEEVGGDQRLKSILESRDCDEEVISSVLNGYRTGSVDYYSAVSKFTVNGMDHWRLNDWEQAGVISRITIPNNTCDKVDFYPMDDAAAFVKLNLVSVNGVGQDPVTDFEYLKKSTGHYRIDVSAFKNIDVRLEITWEYERVDDFLNKTKS